jgi:phosphatidylserine/phosphatidylglycerophosphate/cardiolipin synthase-like enzyme
MLESELAAAVARGVRVRLIAPVQVNSGTPEIQQLQFNSLTAPLAVGGVDAHVSGPDETARLPYMHARAAVVDGKIAYLGSVSLSPDSIIFNREMGLILQQPSLVRDRLRAGRLWRSSNHEIMRRRDVRQRRDGPCVRSAAAHR